MGDVIDVMLFLSRLLVSVSPMSLSLSCAVHACHSSRELSRNEPQDAAEHTAARKDKTRPGKIVLSTRTSLTPCCWARLYLPTSPYLTRGLATVAC